jgi:NAD(P)-dependent dehydrogenase (short-subunit alcohol dehydrogenase family)
MTTFIRSDSDIPDQSGRTVIVTGANSGIGRAAARALATRGAHVVLAVRTVAKGQEVAAQLPGSTEVRELDLASLESVRAFASAWDGPIDVLINNAGIMMTPAAKTIDGFETQFGTNHLGHFALTNLLLEQVTGRVVTVSSVGHRMGAVDFADLQWDRKPYSPHRAYGQSKLANLLFTSELQRRLTAAGSPVLANAAHPGYASTNLTAHSGSRAFELIAGIGARLIAQSEEAGALPTLSAALADVPGDSYFGPSGFMEQRGKPKLIGRSKAAQDPAVARRLWEVSEELTQTHFPLGAQVDAAAGGTTSG